MVTVVRYALDSASRPARCYGLRWRLMSRMNVSRIVSYWYDRLVDCLEKQLQRKIYGSYAYLGLNSIVIVMQAYLHHQ